MIPSWARPAIAWLAILALAVLNGALREGLLLPNVGRAPAYIASGAILSACVLAVAFVLARWMRLRDARRALAVGALWLVLTVAFEFGFGLARGESWGAMLEAYTFKGGNIWPIVLAVTFFAPLIVLRMRAAE